MHNIENFPSSIPLVLKGILPITVLRRNLCFHLIRVSLPAPRARRPSCSVGHFRKKRGQWPGSDKGDGLTSFFFKVLEKLLVEDESHATNFFHLGLRRAVSVYEVGGDGDSQLPPEFFPSEPCAGKREDVGLSSRFGVKAANYQESYSQMPHRPRKPEFWMSSEPRQAETPRFAPEQETRQQRPKSLGPFPFLKSEGPIILVRL